MLIFKVKIIHVQNGRQRMSVKILTYIGAVQFFSLRNVFSYLMNSTLC